jgi:hypothetical protein
MDDVRSPTRGTPESLDGPAGGPSRFETQGCAADGTADSPELWRCADRHVCGGDFRINLPERFVCTNAPFLNSKLSALRFQAAKPGRVNTVLSGKGTNVEPPYGCVGRERRRTAMRALELLFADLRQTRLGGGVVSLNAISASLLMQVHCAVLIGIMAVALTTPPFSSEVASATSASNSGYGGGGPPC